MLRVPPWLAQEWAEWVGLAEATPSVLFLHVITNPPTCWFATDCQYPLGPGGSWPCRSTISCKTPCLQPGDTRQQWCREQGPQQEVVGPPSALALQSYKDPWQRTIASVTAYLKGVGISFQSYLLCDGGRKCNDIIWGRGNVRVQAQPLVRAENRTLVPFYLRVKNIKDRQETGLNHHPYVNCCKICVNTEKISRGGRLLPEWCPLLDSPPIQSRTPGFGTCLVQCRRACNNVPPQNCWTQEPGSGKRWRKKELTWNSLWQMLTHRNTHLSGQAGEEATAVGAKNFPAPVLPSWLAAIFIFPAFTLEDRRRERSGRDKNGKKLQSV